MENTVIVGTGKNRKKITINADSLTPEQSIKLIQILLDFRRNYYLIGKEGFSREDLGRLSLMHAVEIDNLLSAIANDRIFNH